MAHPTFHSMKAQGKRDHSAQVHHHAHADGGSVKNETKKAIEKAVHEHEGHDHKGHAKTKIKLKHGGEVEGHAAKRRLDRASGGRTEKKGGSKGKKGSGNHVNIVVAGGGHPPGGGAPGAAPAALSPLPPGAGPMPPKPPMPPPPAGPPMGGPPVGAGVPPGMPPMRAAGGRANRARGGAAMTASAKSGVGRMERIKAYGKHPPAGENHGETEECENEPATGKAA